MVNHGEDIQNSKIHINKYKNRTPLKKKVQEKNKPIKNLKHTHKAKSQALHNSLFIHNTDKRHANQIAPQSIKREWENRGQNEPPQEDRIPI